MSVNGSSPGYWNCAVESPAVLGQVHRQPQDFGILGQQSEPHDAAQVGRVDVVVVVGEQPIAIGDQAGDGCFCGLLALLLRDVCNERRQQVAVQLANEQRRHELALSAWAPLHVGIEQRDRVANAIMIEHQLKA